MNDKFVVKDSGVRQEYASGMRRDTQEGKVNYRLIHIPFLKRLAIHLGKGMVKYGRDNWKLANSPEELERFEDSAERHLMQWLSGEVDEDHAMAVVFNIMAAEYVRDRLDNDPVSFFDKLREESVRIYKEEVTRAMNEELAKENGDLNHD